MLSFDMMENKLRLFDAVFESKSSQLAWDEGKRVVGGGSACFVKLAA